MYLLPEAEFIKRRRQSRSLPDDVQVVTNSLKAVSQKRKRQAIKTTVPPSKIHKYMEGVKAMTDKDVKKPLARRNHPRRSITPQHTGMSHRPSSVGRHAIMHLERFDV